MRFRVMNSDRSNRGVVATREMQRLWEANAEYRGGLCSDWRFDD